MKKRRKKPRRRPVPHHDSAKQKTSPDDALAILGRGAASWNAWRDANPNVAVALRRADVSRFELDNVNFRGADLCHTRFTGANLIDAQFQGARLRKTCFQNANLRGADLSAAGELQAHQLRGALTALAVLPPTLDLYAPLRVVERAAANARKIFAAMLLGCAYTVLTIAATEDASLITNSSTSPLPIIQVQIPIGEFYYAAPLILLGIYLYFHISMGRIWELLATLPAEFPDGRSLDTAADPWLLLGFARSSLARLRTQRGLADRIQAHITTLLAWWVVPLTLLATWGRYVRRHDEVGSALQTLLLAGAIVFGGYSFRRGALVLSGRNRAGSLSRGRAEGWRSYPIELAVALLAALLCAVVSDSAAQNWRWKYQVGASPGGLVTRGRTGAPDRLDRLLNANIAFADVSTKSPGWFAAGELNSESLRFIDRANLARLNLRGAYGQGVFLVGANLQFADFGGADLSAADLRYSNLTGASLRGANLAWADLRWTDAGPQPEQIDESSTRTALLGRFHPLDLTQALLDDADLSGANLGFANIVSASLERATLTGATLAHGHLNGSRLREADLTGADLTWTNLTGVDLHGSNVSGARLYSYGLLQSQLNEACAETTNPVVALPPGLEQPPPCRISIESLSIPMASPIGETETGEWEVQRVVDAITDEASVHAASTNSAGFVLGVQRVEQDGPVYGTLRLPHGWDGDLKGPPAKVALRVDGLKPAQRLATLHRRERAAASSWTQGSTDLLWLHFELWGGKGEPNVGALRDLMDGQRVVVRLYLEHGGYHDARFRLAGARSAIAEALGVQPRFDPTEVKRLQRLREAVDESARACWELQGRALTEFGPCWFKVQHCSDREPATAGQFRECLETTKPPP